MAFVLPPALWAKKKSIRIVDPDGWRVDDTSMNLMLKEEEFDRRAAMSTCEPIPAIKRWSHEAKGKILRSERGVIYVPYEPTKGGGYSAVTIHDPAGTYPPDGYNICVGEHAVENDEEIPLLALMAALERVSGILGDVESDDVAGVTAELVHDLRAVLSVPGLTVAPTPTQQEPS